MITCKTCKKRTTCTRICQRVESLLPKDYTGKDTHREVNMDADAILAVADKCSYTRWHHEESLSATPGLDLSTLTVREKKALLLKCKGVSQRESSALMGISRVSFRTPDGHRGRGRERSEPLQVHQLLRAELPAFSKRQGIRREGRRCRR